MQPKAVLAQVFAVGMALASASALAAPAPQVVRDHQGVEAWLERDEAGRAARIADLERVLRRAPDSSSQIERRGGTVVLRGFDEAEARSLAAALTAPGSGTTAVEIEPNPYGDASLFLGRHAVEMKDYKAAAYLERGLALQPYNPDLTSEWAIAVAALGRRMEAIALLDGWLASNYPEVTHASAGDRARLLRARGFGYVEQGRLDEAEADYRRSLELQPGHGGALAELKYIADLRTGAPRADVEIVTSSEAAERGK